MTLSEPHNQLYKQACGIATGDTQLGRAWKLMSPRGTNIKKRAKKERSVK